MAETNYSSESKAAAQVAAPSLPYQPRDPKSYRPNIGMIATGGITQAHLDAYTKAGYQVTALCDLIESRAKARQKEFYPKATVTTDFREVLADPTIEVVDIAAHPHERPPLVEAALRAGKHVLSQKPFVLDLEVGSHLVAVAKEMDRKLAVNQNGRWSPHFSVIRSAIAAGHIGDVLAAHLSVHWNHDWVANTPFDKVHHVVLYDFAIHWFDILTCFMGGRTADSVYATVQAAKGQTATPPLLGQAMVSYAGAQASLVFDAFTPHGALDTTVVTGTKGMIVATGPDLGTQTVKLITEEGEATFDLEGSWFNDGFHGTMGELLCAIEENREPSNSAANNLASLALCFAAVKSADTGLPQVPGTVQRVG